MNTFRQHYTPPRPAGRSRLLTAAVLVACACTVAFAIAMHLAGPAVQVTPIPTPTVEIFPLPPAVQVDVLTHIRLEAFRAGYVSGVEACSGPQLQLPIGRRS